MFVPKVLVALPTYEGKDYIFKENFEAIKNIDYSNYDYIYIDNTKTTSYLSKLRRRGAKATRVPRNGNSRMALANAQNYARHKAIDGNYDYLMFIESDLIPPRDIITRLVKPGLKVIGASYLIGHEVKVPCVFFLDKTVLGHASGTRIITVDEAKKFMGTGLRQVHGMGLGCTLLRRDVFKNYPYWVDERFTDKHSDVYFYMDLQVDGVPVVVDTDILVPHFPSFWSEVDDR